MAGAGNHLPLRTPENPQRRIAMTHSEKHQRAEHFTEIADDLREKADDAPHIFNDMAEQADKEARSARNRCSCPTCLPQWRLSWS